METIITILPGLAIVGLAGIIIGGVIWVRRRKADPQAAPTDKPDDEPDQQAQRPIWRPEK